MQLRLSPPAAIEACRRAVDSLGWDVTRVDEYHLAAGELPGPAGCCGAMNWPARVEIHAEPDPQAETRLIINALMPGYGRRTAHRLELRVGALESAIREQSTPE
jgi:hypothetical protein